MACCFCAPSITRSTTTLGVKPSGSRLAERVVVAVHVQRRAFRRDGGDAAIGIAAVDGEGQRALERRALALFAHHQHLEVEQAGRALERGRADAQVAAARVGRHGVLEQHQFLVQRVDLAAGLGQVGRELFMAGLVGVALLGGFFQLGLQALAFQVGGAEFAVQLFGLLHRQALRAVVVCRKSTPPAPARCPPEAAPASAACAACVGPADRRRA